MCFVVCFVASSLLSCTSLVLHTVRLVLEYHEHFQCSDSLIILCNDLWHVALSIVCIPTDLFWFLRLLQYCHNGTKTVSVSKHHDCHGSWENGSALHGCYQ